MAIKKTKRAGLETVGDVFAEVGRVPRHRMPAEERDPDVVYQIVHDELMLDGNARLNLATFVGTWMEPQAERLMAETFDKNMIDKDEYPADRRDGDALRRHDQPAVACPRSRRGARLLDDRLERGGHARRPRAQAALAEGAAGRRQAGRPAQHRHGHQRPGVLGEVRQLLGGRAAPRARWKGTASTCRPRRRSSAVRREHDRRRRRPGLDVRRLVRAGRGDLPGARRAAGADRPGHPGPRRRAPRVASSRPFWTPTSSGTSAWSASPRSTRPVTSTGWWPPASAGSSGATRMRSPTS